jgi:hypothetical protein
VITISHSPVAAFGLEYGNPPEGGAVELRGTSVNVGLAPETDRKLAHVLTDTVYGPVELPTVSVCGAEDAFGK